MLPNRRNIQYLITPACQGSVTYMYVQYNTYNNTEGLAVTLYASLPD